MGDNSRPSLTRLVVGVEAIVANHCPPTEIMAMAVAIH